MKRQIVIGILSGIGIIFVTHIFVTIFSIWYTNYNIQILSVDSFRQELQSPSLISQFINWIKLLLQYGAYILAGFFCVKQIKKNGQFYGGIVGVIWIIVTYVFSIGIVLYYIALPDNMISQYPQTVAMAKQRQIDSLTKNIPQKGISAVFIIGLTILGGSLAERKMKKTRE